MSLKESIDAVRTALQEYDDGLPATRKDGHLQPGARAELAAADPVILAVENLLSEAEFLQAQLTTVLRATFGSQYKDEHQEGKIAMAQEVANILGWGDTPQPQPVKPLGGTGFHTPAWNTPDEHSEEL